MSDFLYEKFLEDRDIYRAARAFWASEISHLVPGRALQPYLADKFEDGELFYDGNPIANAVNLKTGKAARIVQESPQEFGKFYKSWNQPASVRFPGGEQLAVQEKVIVLTLTRESLERSLQELQDWLA
ncbi:hypothetical protein ACLB1G_20120 [Oxalobacteraceae bacterium A2-2]